MRTVTIAGIIVLLLGIPVAAHASDNLEPMVMLAAFAVIDYNQTCEALFERTGHREANPILGEYPTRTELAAFGIIGMGAVYLSQKLLPESWAQVVMDSVLASERMNIEENVRTLDNQRRQISGVPIVLSFRF